jgi:hypothetical protein
MFLLTGLAALDKRIVAYDFLKDSGVDTTAEKTGHTTQKLFGADSTLNSGIGLMISAFLSFLGVIFLILIIYAGILWMIAEGDEAKVEKAKAILTRAIVGLIIVLAAYAISFFVINALAPQALK